MMIIMVLQSQWMKFSVHFLSLLSFLSKFFSDLLKLYYLFPDFFWQVFIYIAKEKEDIKYILFFFSHSMH